MSKPYDPYHDEDADDVAPITTAFNQNNEAAFARTFKQMGDALKNGGFCSPRKDLKNQKKESDTVDAKNKGDSSADLTSLSDESHRSNKSVSFCGKLY